MPPPAVVLDAFTLTPHRLGHPAPAGEPSWDRLAGLTDLTVHPRTAPDEAVERLQGAAVGLTNKVRLDAAAFDALPDLRFVNILATGTDAVDLDAARRHGVTVANVPAYSSASVAQHVFALLLELTNAVGEHDAAVQRGDWAASPDFSFTLRPLTELAGLTLGVVGTGDIGTRVLRVAHGLGMNLAAHSRTQKDLGLPVTWLGLDELFSTCDVVSLHCPLTDDTRGLVNAKRLDAMKPSAYLINTGRGPLIAESALVQALHDGSIAGAGLDVLSKEPPPADHPLVGAPNCIITPHIAWATRAARGRMMNTVVDNIEAFLNGNPQNVANPK